MMYNIYGGREEDELEASYAEYLAEQAQEEWERQIEDDAYNQIIIPQYLEALEEEAKTM